jgi:aryl-phospho-beta-D-glucosidase BglC (GH1 family)
MTYEFQGFNAGVNLGGWISQFGQLNKEHFDSFITKSDIKQIADWGMDHVRLPIDYNVLEDDDQPFIYKEEGFSYIDRCIEWCQEYGLNIILDLHRTAGYAFHSLETNKLFENNTLQERFIGIWKAFATRYRKYGDNVVFELLNEIVEPNSERWNMLSKRAVEAIRLIDPARVIIIGGNYYNSVNALKELDYINDDRLVYTFHFYEPHLFTHQRASWEKAMKELNYQVSYPVGTEDYKNYMHMSDSFRKSYYINDNMGKDYLKEALKPALEFAAERKAALYCGEYGAIETADMASRLRWHEDLSSLLIEYGIGRAVWSYKLMNFSMVDVNSKVVDNDLIKIVSIR